MLAFVMACALVSWVLDKPEVVIEKPETLPVNDIMLLTAEEHERTRLSGIGSYSFDGIYYVNESLPEEYWTKWRGPYD